MESSRVGIIRGATVAGLRLVGAVGAGEAAHAASVLLTEGGCAALVKGGAAAARDGDGGDRSSGWHEARWHRRCDGG